MQVTLYEKKEKIFTDPNDYNSYVFYSSARNYSEVDMEGVNHLVIRREGYGEMYITQASGYTYDRGTFIDMYEARG